MSTFKEFIQEGKQEQQEQLNEWQQALEGTVYFDSKENKIYEVSFRGRIEQGSGPSIEYGIRYNSKFGKKVLTPFMSFSSGKFESLKDLKVWEIKVLKVAKDLTEKLDYALTPLVDYVTSEKEIKSKIGKLAKYEFVDIRQL